MSTSTHRLATVSASEALQEASELVDRDGIKLGLEHLDALLSGSASTANASKTGPAGILRGEVTEIYGPPGAGKSTLCLQAAAAALVAGTNVLWIDTATPVVGERLEDILDGCIEKQKVDLDTDLGNHLTKEECLSRLTHYVAPTLPHLLALLFHTPESFPAKNVGLIVVDSISVPIDNAYPRTVDEKLRRAKNETSRWVSGRRQAVISDMANRLAKLAALRHLAILVTSNMITKVRVDREALLCPAIASQDWENAVTRRVCLYRDWIPRSKEHGSSRGGAVVEAGRLARGAGKGAGTGTVADPVPYAVAFEIGKSGIREVCLCREDVPVVHTPTNNAAGGASAGASRKRRRDDATDSDDSTHEYGWEENDDDFAAEELIDASFV